MKNFVLFTLLSIIPLTSVQASNCLLDLYNVINRARMTGYFNDIDAVVLRAEKLSNQELLNALDLYMIREYSSREYLRGLSPREMPKTINEFLVFDNDRGSYHYLKQPLSTIESIIFSTKETMEYGMQPRMIAKEMQQMIYDFSILKQVQIRLENQTLSLLSTN